jgi:protein-tyrosine phosphatase
MRAEIYPIPIVPSGRLAIMPRPRAGEWLEGEIESWRRSGLDVIVSLLEDCEIGELGLQQEQALCERAGLEFIRFPIPDCGVPDSADQFAALIQSLAEQLQNSRGVGIHCRMGIGRSSLVAAHLLAALGVPVESAWESIEKSRGFPVPDTPEQRAWHV